MGKHPPYTIPYKMQQQICADMPIMYLMLYIKVQIGYLLQNLDIPLMEYQIV